MVTVTATAFHGGRERTVLLQIQPARNRAATAGGVRGLGDRRLRIRTFGETVIETPTGDELRGDWLDQRPGLLLKFLVTQRHRPTHADAIAEALWPRARPDTTNTVRHFIHALRDKLEPDRERYKESTFVLSRKGGYQLNPERIIVDADEFESATRAGLTALAAGQAETASASFEAAIALYRGEYLPEERYEEWAIPERERLRDLACRPLRAMATLSDDVGRASVYLERLAEMEPLDIDVQRELLGTWLRQGRRSRALRHYRALQLRLMREFGERVTFDLAELGQQGAS
jgi:DNA-binding SARP family transcriptional activator